MAILQFHQSSDESSDEPVVLEIVPESDRELLVIHRHPRPASVRTALELTPIGLQVMYRLVEVLRGWPKSLPKGLNCFSVALRKRNGEFLDKFITDVELITENFRTKSVDEETSEDLRLPGRLVYALLLINVNPHSERQRDQCLICDLPIEQDRRARSLPTDVELCYTNSNCGYWTLIGISLNPGFVDGFFKLCPHHELSLTRILYTLIIKQYYQASDTTGNRDWGVGGVQRF